ncbi:MAG: prepilin-type N-terminal cleavage/methylation domain-containing protein [Candidatus Paceibacterota bacterium]|jgi:prepilin-type N-terminal cleavage/methylation domain-containing protein
MKNISSKIKGFTLIELLVVIAIIGILTSIVMVSLQGARAKSRDAKIVSDIAQIQLALEQFFDRNGVYPSGIYTSGIGFSPNYISNVPKSPTGTNYGYITDTDKYDYVLSATFETSNQSVLDGLNATSKPSYASSFTCDNASGSKNYCMGPK